MARKRIGRRRWAALVKFLTETMQTSNNERTRMQAAMRLSEILIAREQRETAELRATRKMEPESAKDAEQQQPEPDATEDKVDAIVRELYGTGNADAAA